MKTISHEVLPDLDLRIVRVFGAVSIDELRAYIDREFDLPLARNVMWHAYPGSMQHLGLDELKDLLTWRKNEINRRSGGCTILVADDPIEASLMTWYKTYALSQEFHEVQFYACVSEEEGRELVQRLNAAS